MYAKAMVISMRTEAVTIISISVIFSHWSNARPLSHHHGPCHPMQKHNLQHVGHSRPVSSPLHHLHLTSLLLIIIIILFCPPSKSNHQQLILMPIPHLIHLWLSLSLSIQLLLRRSKQSICSSFFVLKEKPPYSCIFNYSDPHFPFDRSKQHWSWFCFCWLEYYDHCFIIISTLTKVTLIDDELTNKIRAREKNLAHERQFTGLMVQWAGVSNSISSSILLSFIIRQQVVKYLLSLISCQKWITVVGTIVWCEYPSLVDRILMLVL